VGDKRGRHWWREIGTLVAVTGLLITLVFNTIGVWRDVESGQDARDTAQISLMTQLIAQSTEAEAAIDATDAPEARCQTPSHGLLDPKEEAVLLRGLSYYEYVAFLLNHERLTIDGSRQYFGPRMIDAQFTGERLMSEDVRVVYPELTRFRERAPRSLMPPEFCPE
jgi:hypothetical protein